LPDAWQCSEEYLYGVDLYNHAYWWEAHEAWEGLWQLTDKGAVQGRFLQGLIQASAAHLKLWTSHSEGVKRLWPSSLGYLRFALEHAGMEPYMGVALAEFVTDLDAYFRRLLSVAPIMRCDAERFPYITLQGIKPGVSACPW
jgi:hypothetical protein